MNLQIPTRIKVGAKTFQVMLSRSWDADKGHDNFGKTNFGTQQIFIDNTVHPEQATDTFIHEVMHVVLSEAGFGDEISCTEEELVCRITPVLQSLIAEFDTTESVYINGARLSA